MKSLHETQKSFLADIFKTLISIAAAALIFGQFIPGEHIDWKIVLGGSILVGVMMWYAVRLKRPDIN